ncbi:MAG: hypothetical protein GX308_06245 [Epulopiscium sp.]|nr:hypothetical protein [Candidatus Epulonipiscium sp.]
MQGWKIKCVLLALIGVFIISYIYMNDAVIGKHQTEIHFLELPIGDCTLIKTKEKDILIGEAAKKDSKHIIQYLENQKSDNVIELIITSPKKTKIEGFINLIEKDKIKKIYVPHISELDTAANKFLNTAKDKGVLIYQISDKEKWEIDDLTLSFLRPSKNSTVPQSEKKAIIKLESSKLSILCLPPITDMDKRDLLLNKKELKSEILKISGAEKETLLTKDFLDSINPKTILFGDNTKVKEKDLRAIYEWNPKTNLFSIYQEGDIILYKDRKKYKMTTKRVMNIRIQ